MDNELRPDSLDNEKNPSGTTGGNPTNDTDSTTSSYGSYSGGGYYQGYYNPQWSTPHQWGGYSQEPKPPKKKSGLRALVAVLIVVLLLAGIAAGTFFIAPMISDWQSVARNEKPSELPKDNTLEPVESSQSGGNSTSSQSGEVPKIGGETPNIDASENPIVQIAKNVGPAVVGVTVSVRQQTSWQQDAEERESGYGTGIIISEEGYIVTNNHVIVGSDYVKITLIDGTEYPATVVGTDATTDLAVLKIEATGLTVVALGDSDKLQVGETVVAIGNPLGSKLAGSVTAGIVSAVGREISTNGYSQKYIQTDAAINPGNSGGALVNIRGEVIGINTLKSYLAGYDAYGVPIGTEGIGFAIPINTAKPIIEQLIATGSVVRPGIGISCLVDETDQFNPPGSPKGVTVVKVTEGGPADVAGLQPGDIITAVDGQEVTTVDELTSILHEHAVGDKVELNVWRKGQNYRAVVVVGDLNKMQM